MDVKQNIRRAVSDAAQTLFGETVEIKLETPEDLSHGDYSCNIALQLSKKVGKNPREIAESIKNNMSQIEDVENIEIAGPGFLNFFLTKEYLQKNLAIILSQQETYGSSDVLKDKKVMVEFTDPNPLKEFHIGHLYSNTVGESLSRLFESQGANVWRVNYQGDVGLHVAKAVWGIQKKLEGMSLTIDKLAEKSLEERAKFLGESYAMGAKAFDDDNSKQEIIALNKKIYERDPSVYPLYEKAKGWSLEYFDSIYQRLGTKFKRYYFESEAGPIGLEVIKSHMGDIFIEDQGAIVFPKEKSGLHTRVFVNSLGIPTYEGKELGLAPTKYKDFPYDISVIVTGNEINEYFKVLLKALSMIEPELAAKTNHIGHGMVRLPSGKMSSRSGDVITGEWLLTETKNKLTQAYPDMSPEVAEMLTVGAIKYALLKSGIGQNITFSIEESISLHGSSGPYIQYSYARTQSILGNVDAVDNQVKVKLSKIEKEEEALLKYAVHFSEVVEEAAERFAPNLVASYLFELSQAFNLFYEKHRITNAEDTDVKNFRVVLTAGVGQVLKNGLTLLGILTPPKI